MKKNEYNHLKIEKKWQNFWTEKKIYQTEQKSKKPKHYVLDMFPYPSGAGLHVGHPRGYIGSDVYARMKRMQGYNVLHPMGYDAFGLPAEQYAIEHKIHPRKAVEKNIKTFRGQLDKIGFSYDWSRSVNTTDPEYYKWTQWIFLQIYNSYYNEEKNKARPISELIKKFEKTDKNWKKLSEIEKEKILMNYRLAYEGYSEVNWCPKLGTVLANDEIVDDKDSNPVSERGGYPVEKKSMRQWFMRITAYADRLVSDLDGLNWSSHIKEIQKNWIGASEGSIIKFDDLEVFTTRADTLYGVTYVAIHGEKDRFTGRYVTHPATKEKIPVWEAEYVMADYGTGAVMGVPAHDERDFEFAKKHNLPVKQVILEITGIKKEIETYVRGVCNIVFDLETKKFAVVEWTNGLYGLIAGGVNQEELNNLEGAMRRELLEEGGLYDIKNISYLWETESHYFNHAKNTNRNAHITCFLTLLNSGKTKETSREAHETFELGWHSVEEIFNNWEERNQNHDYDHWKSFLEKALIILNKNGLYTERVLNIKNNIFIGEGKLIYSNQFDGLTSEEARKKITEFVGGKLVKKYKIRDAVFARQRYWGEPIPLIHNADGTISEVADKKLPLVLPSVTSYEPTGTGESPLAGVKAWTKAGYETNTMPGWAGSSWYFLRYIDPKNKKNFASPEALDYWFGKKDGGVDMYVGGAEHATGHLLYSRFWHKFLYDMGYVKAIEPFRTLRNQGMIGGADGRKMSKRWGNVINPDDVVKTYGADTLRVYEAFMGPFDQGLPWSTESIIGSRRFVEKVWRLAEKVKNQKSTIKHSEKSIEKILHKTIKKVSEDIENFSFNTAVSAMMICVNEMESASTPGFGVTKKDFELFLQILAPFAPHMTEELWNSFGGKKSIHLSPWPKYNPKNIVDDEITLAVQVNGKVRAEITVAADMSDDDVKAYAIRNEKVLQWIEGKEIKKVIYVKGRLVSVVI